MLWTGQTVYEWDQNVEEVNMYIRLPLDVPKKLFACKIESKHLTIGIKDLPPYMNVSAQLALSRIVRLRLFCSIPSIQRALPTNVTGQFLHWFNPTSLLSAPRLSVLLRTSKFPKLR